jgi:cysteine desulfurase / selenocysteine lyase
MLHVDLKDFPTARAVTYLNSASISLMPTPAVDSMVKFQQQIAAGGTIGFDEEAETQALEGVRNEAASLLGTRKEQIAILSSATIGICSFAWSVDLKRGSNVVSTDADFPSVVYPWMRLRDEKGIEVRLAKNHDGVVNEDELENLVDNHTAVVSISHVEYGTGQRFDLRWLSELAHSHGALLLVDATQSAGLIPIDMDRDRIDVLVAGGYKGLLGPFGAAILYLNRELVERLEPPLVGWRSTPNPYNLNATELTYANDARKFEYSTMDYASPFGLAESMRYLAKMGHENVTDHTLSLTEKFIDIIRNDHARANVTTLTPEKENAHGSIASFRFEGRDQSAIAAEFGKRQVVVSQRFNGVRFSFHVYNTEEDLLRASRSLKEILAT